MTRRNFLPLAGLLLSAIALVSYPLFFVDFPATRDVPWANWLLFALALVLAGAGIARPFRRPERYRGRILAPILGVLSLAILGFFIHMTEIASRQLPAAADAPRVGERAPDFTLPDVQERPVRLAEMLAPQATASGASGSWVLLIFYRGYW
ncbi:MAG: hypothetical protein ACREQQ_13990 [Candidatus Binatia bacterium]